MYIRIKFIIYWHNILWWKCIVDIRQAKQKIDIILNMSNANQSINENNKNKIHIRLNIPLSIDFVVTVLFAMI